MQITEYKLIQHHIDIINEWNRYYTGLIDNIFTNQTISSFLDLGANTGAVIEFILSKKSIPKVYAIEPLDNNYQLLQSIKERFSSENISIKTFPLAVYYGLTEAKTYELGDNNTGGMFLDGVKNELESIIEQKLMKPIETGFTFKCDTLENILSDVKSIDLCKMDVEGSEWNIIRHSSFIKEKINNIILEFHWLTRDEAIKFLNEHLSNFSIVDFVHNSIWLKNNNYLCNT